MNQNQQFEFRGDKSTIYDLGSHVIEVYHVIPFMMGLWIPSKVEADRGAKEVVYYASASANNGFKTTKNEIMGFNDVQYMDMDTLYLESEKGGNYREAFRHLVNVQSVALRAIADCKELFIESTPDKVYMTREQFEYMHHMLVKLIRSCESTLKFHKAILENDEKDITNLQVSTIQKSHNTQKLRVARAVRILKNLGVV